MTATPSLQLFLSGTMPLVRSVIHRFVRVNGVNLHVAEAGSGEPLLLLHGWPQHWYMWRHQIPELAKRYRVICPDMRGFGWSDAPRGGYQKEQLTDDAIALLDALQLERVRLMGHDWGAWIGFLLCLRQPERVERFVALGAPHPFQSPDARIFSLWRFWYQILLACPGIGHRLLTRQRFAQLILRLGSVRKTCTARQLHAYAERLSQPARAMASVSLYRTFLLREFLAVLFGRYRGMRLTVPTLLLLGSKDAFLSPRLLDGYQRNADNLGIELVANCGHFIAEEQPELVTRRALHFFASLAAARLEA